MERAREPALAKLSLYAHSHYDSYFPFLTEWSLFASNHESLVQLFSLGRKDMGADSDLYL